MTKKRKPGVDRSARGRMLKKKRHAAAGKKSSGHEAPASSDSQRVIQAENAKILKIGDAEIIEVELPIKKAGLGYRFRRPTDAELLERKRLDHAESVIHGQCWLWDQMILEVRGYGLEGVKDAMEWRAVDDAIRGLIPVAHKVESALEVLRLLAAAKAG